MAIMDAVLAAGWVPFVVVFMLVLLFSFLYVRYFQSHYDSELCSTLTSVAGISVALLTCALVPVDIFLVSFMKDSNGQFKDWANNLDARRSIENDVLYAYYTLYGVVILFIFILLPFSYFFYEETDEDRTTSARCCSALKYSIGFVIVCAVLMVVGAFASVQHVPKSNSTDWLLIQNIFEAAGQNRGTDAISFVISSLTLLGMVLLVLYTAYGMTAWPMDLIKGRRSASREHQEVVGQMTDIEAEIDAIKARYPDGRRRMTTRNRTQLDELEDRKQLLSRRQVHLDAVSGRNKLRKCCAVVARPFEITVGIFCGFLAILILLSLLLTNIDKIQNSLGWRLGYALPSRKLPNPIDIMLVFAQKVFPIDYILLVLIVIYLFMSSMGAIQHMGIWCCWIKVYKIRPRRTRPQGLLFMCFIMMFIVLAFNILIYELTPQYSTYGGQHYILNHTETHGNTSKIVTTLEPCSAKAPMDECTMTRMSLLLVRFFYKVWFFGVCYYWASWLFLAVLVLGFTVVLVRKRRSSIEGVVDREDFDSDDEVLIPS